MDFKYETSQLIMRVCNRGDARMVYDFYRRNLLDFAQYEPLDMKSAVTLIYYESLLDVELELLLKHEVARYFLFEKSNPFRIVGTIAFRNFNYAPHLMSCQVGYKIDRDFRRRGFAREAIYTGCDVMFHDEKLHRIEATVLPDNFASCRLLEGLGFVREGLLRGKIKLNGVWTDHYLYALVNDE